MAPTKSPSRSPAASGTAPRKTAAPRAARLAPPQAPADAIQAVPQLEMSFGYLFKQAHRAFTRTLAKRLKPHGITLAQWYFLRELWQEDGITQRELSRRMDVSEPTTTVAVDLMEKVGLVERQRDPAQRNSINLCLTRKGKQLKGKVLHIAFDVNADATLGIDPRKLQPMRESILQMIANLNE